MKKFRNLNQIQASLEPQLLPQEDLEPQLGASDMAPGATSLSVPEKGQVPSAFSPQLELQEEEQSSLTAPGATSLDSEQVLLQELSQPPQEPQQSSLTAPGATPVSIEESELFSQPITKTRQQTAARFKRSFMELQPPVGFGNGH